MSVLLVPAAWISGTGGYVQWETGGELRHNPEMGTGD